MTGSSPAMMAWRVAKHQMLKHDVYNDVMRRLREGEIEEGSVIGFEDQLWQHFNRLPARHALDVNMGRAKDVLVPAIFRVSYDSHRNKDTITADFRGSAIGRVAPVDSGFWWIILLRSYARCIGDYSLSELPEVLR